MKSVLDIARTVLNAKEYVLFEYTVKMEQSPVSPLTQDELSKKSDVPLSDLDNVKSEACRKVDHAIDLQRMKGDPDISEVYALQNKTEYNEVMSFLINEKKFGAENDVRRARWRIQESGETIEDQVDVGYYYRPLMEFRAFEGTRLEEAIREYKEKQVSSK